MSVAPDWVQDAVFYQIFPERFCNGDAGNDPQGVRPWGERPDRESRFGGDLDGVRLRLPYLQDLGVTALYLTPVFTAPSSHKYDTADYFQVDPCFGGNRALKELVQRAHDLGMRVVLDGVFNHTGDQFWAFRDVVARGERSDYVEWYSFEGLPVCTDPPNYRACGGAPFLPKLRTSNPAVREYLYGVATHWLREAGIDGWRLDVPWEVSHDFWRGFRRAVKAVSPDAYLVGEAWGDPSPWLLGDQFDGATHYRLRELLLRFVVQQAIDAATFDRELCQLQSALPDWARRTMLTLLGSHDTPRIATLAAGKRNTIRTLYVLLFTLEGVPLIYYGDEVGVEGGPDPDCRRCMPWSPGEWDEGLRAHIRRLVQIRKAHPALRRGGHRMVLCQERAYVFSRATEGDTVVTAVNAGFQPERLAIPLETPGRIWTDLLTGERFTADVRGEVRLCLGPGTAGVLVPLP